MFQSMFEFKHLHMLDLWKLFTRYEFQVLKRVMRKHDWVKFLKHSNWEMFLKAWDLWECICMQSVYKYLSKNIIESKARFETCLMQEFFISMVT